MPNGNRDKVLENIKHELRMGIKLLKCRKCGCMKNALETLMTSIPKLSSEEAGSLQSDIQNLLDKMEPLEYSCLGCRHCFAAEAMNLFQDAFPKAMDTCVGCRLEIRESWPPVPGEYYAFCEGMACPVAVSTLGSVELAEKLAISRPKELCIVGKTETENIGVEKVIKNTITNPTIRFLLLAGRDPEGHYSGKTLLALWKKGVDENMRVIGSPGRRPILRNVSKNEVEAFRKQVKVIDLIGCEDKDQIIKKLKELAHTTLPLGKAEPPKDETEVLRVEVVYAEEPREKEMDKAGYFVIIPQREKKLIIVEHYSYDNKLLRIIKGRDAKSIYWTIIKNNWVTQLSHAAYLGKELMKAELSIKIGFKYVQDAS